MQGYILSGAISVVIYSYCNEPRTPQCTELSARDEWSKAYVGLGGRDGMHLLQISQMQSQRTVGDFRKYGFHDCRIAWGLVGVHGEEGLRGHNAMHIQYL